MNRIYLCIAGILIMIYACSNNLETIGQDIVDNNNYIGTEDVQVLNTATFRLDSFPTSSVLADKSNFCAYSPSRSCKLESAAA